MNTIKNTIIALALLLSTGAFAQDTLGIGPAGVVGIPDPAFANDTYTYTVEVQNKSSNAFTGDVDVFVGFYDQVEGMNIAGYQHTMAVSLAPQATTSINVDVEYDSDSYASLAVGGGNTVVIWPVTNGGVTKDSLSTDFHLNQDSLGIDLINNVHFPTEIEAGSYDSVAFDLINLSQREVTKDLQIWLWSQSVNNLNYTYTSVDYASNQGTTLAPGEVKHVAIEQYFDSTFYKMGGNTVVIWPVAPGMETRDTLKNTITIVEPTGVGMQNLFQVGEDVHLKPNFGGSDIIVVHPESERIEQVRVNDAAGRIVYVGSNVDRFKMDVYDAGIYFISVKSSKKNYSFKFLKK